MMWKCMTAAQRARPLLRHAGPSHGTALMRASRDGILRAAPRMKRERA